MRTLTNAELASYHVDGYVVVPGLFPTDEMAHLDREVDTLLDGGDGGTASPWEAPDGWLFAPHRQESQVCADFARDPRLLALIGGVVSPGVALHSSKLVAKVPRSDEFCHWHQDESYYFDADDPEMTSSVRMSAWIPLQDATVENGCLWVVPGSHRWGIEAYEEVGTGHCRRRILRADFADEHAIPLPVSAGDTVLFSAFLWHQSRGNHTDGVRRAFIISYQEASLPRDAYGDVAPVLVTAP